MSIFQIIALLFALFMAYIVSIHRKKSRLNTLEVGFWYVVWFGFAGLALFPQILTGVTDALRFARVFDLLLVIALMIITTVVIVNYFTQKENSRKLEQVVRDKAIRKIAGEKN